jgi:hypothetical protein
MWFRAGVCIFLAAALVSCASDSGGVVDKVLVDFGIKEKPEGYVEPSDRVYTKLDMVGKAELKRLNQANQNGEIKFQEGDGVGGKYYKEVKIYESFHPLDAQRQQRANMSDAGYTGVVEYTYMIYQSARKSNRTEAAAEQASIRTGKGGREAYRYHFNSAGEWLGGSGERVKS